MANPSQTQPESSTKKARLPPRWFMHVFWRLHRGVYRLTGGRLGLWRPKPDGWGTMRLTTIGRRTGRERSVMVGYFVDGPNLVTMAMNGWGEGEPAWWLNLQAHPDVSVDLKDGPRLVTGRAAQDEQEPGSQGSGDPHCASRPTRTSYRARRSARRSASTAAVRSQIRSSRT